MTIFHILWIIGLLVYQIGIYIPRVRAYKQKDRVTLVALSGDIFLELTTWVFWQLAPLESCSHLLTTRYLVGQAGSEQ